MSRLAPLDPETLTPEAKRIHDEIGGRRKSVRGPFAIWLRHPALADHANRFGLALRDDGRIERRIFELVVLVLCRLWTVQYAWASHAPQAEAAGVSPQVIAAIRDHQKPDFVRDDERVAYEVATELMTSKALSPQSYAAAVAQFGEDGAVDLVSTIGYYAMVAVMLKGFDVPPLEGGNPLKQDAACS
jgi:4-carboxymuconolactone decarboxylase